MEQLYLQSALSRQATLNSCGCRNYSSSQNHWGDSDLGRKLISWTIFGLNFTFSDRLANLGMDILAGDRVLL